MNENITMTRISELPEPGQPSFPQQQPAFPQQQPTFPQQQPHQQQPMHGQATSFPQMGEMSTMYVPLNPHPNPYGIPDQPPGGMLPPQSQNPYAQPRPPIDGIPHIGPEPLLPMHDIPMDLTTYTHDEQIKPNYVPKPKITADYIRRHENATEHNVREYEAEKRAEAHRSEWFEALNMPIMAAILFLIYQYFVSP